VGTLILLIDAKDEGSELDGTAQKGTWVLQQGALLRIYHKIIVYFLLGC
jgi:hypothetical protein